MAVLRYLFLVIAIAVMVFLYRRQRATTQRAIVSTAALPARHAPPCGEKIIESDGIGKLKLGLTVDSIKKICRVEFDTVRPGPEGMTQRVLVIAFDRDTIEAEIVGDSVWRLDVRSRAFKTPDSIGVGSPVSQLLASFPAQGVTGEGNFAVASRSGCGTSFILQGVPARMQRASTPSELAKLPSDVYVKRILVYKCPDRPVH